MGLKFCDFMKNDISWVLEFMNFNLLYTWLLVVYIFVETNNWTTRISDTRNKNCFIVLVMYGHLVQQ